MLVGTALKPKFVRKITEPRVVVESLPVGTRGWRDAGRVSEQKEDLKGEKGERKWMRKDSAATQGKTSLGVMKSTGL